MVLDFTVLATGLDATGLDVMLRGVMLLVVTTLVTRDRFVLSDRGQGRDAHTGRAAPAGVVASTSRDILINRDEGNRDGLLVMKSSFDTGQTS
jgi:hypothetical protein